MAVNKTYGAIQFNGTQWQIKALEPHVRIKLKSLFPKIPKYSPPPYPFDDTPDVCADLVWFMSRYPLDISSEDRERMDGNRALFYGMQAEMERILLPGWTPQTTYSLKEGQSLRHYQSQAVEVHDINRSLLLLDDVGLGKTVTGIGSIIDQKKLPALILVKTHLWKQWREKIEEFSNLSAHVIKGTKPYELPASDVYIIKYSCLIGWSDYLSDMRLPSFIADEIQDLRTGTASGKGCAARAIAARAQWRLGLSASPMYNYPIELWNIMEILKPGCLGTEEEFVREWCTMHGQHAIVNDPDALGTYLREKYLVLRRTKREVGLELPEVNRIVEYVEHNADAVRDIEQMAISLAMKVVNGTFTESGMAARELDMMMRLATGVSKAAQVASFVATLLESGEKIVLTGWHREVYRIWLDMLAKYRPVMFTGTESDSQKEKSKKAFLSDETNLMIMSLRSGEGIDGLQEQCSIICHGELDWSPKIHYQIRGRLDRPGQKNPPVTEIYLISNFGSDPVIVDLHGLKNSQSQGIVDPGLGPQMVNSDRSRLQFLAQKCLEKAGVKVNKIATNNNRQPVPDIEHPLYPETDALF